MSELLHPARPYSGPLYLYLTEAGWADAWIKGGNVPISCARKYKGTERSGTTTPDEINQAKWENSSPETFRRAGINFGANLKRGTFSNIAIESRDDEGNPVYSSIMNAAVQLAEEDAYLLCLSRKATVEIRDRLKKSVCVQIVDLPRLVSTLDGAIGHPSVSGRVEWTTGPNRGHFLKSYLDSWQMEYRITWPGIFGPDLEVMLPPGIATLIDLSA